MVRDGGGGMTRERARRRAETFSGSSRLPVFLFIFSPPMSELAYAVHTRTCTYLLDEDGFCRWILSPVGTLPSDARQCEGAQFVACVDPEAPGGLVGELRVGASALFARESDEGRLVLLRTGRIAHVELRGGQAMPAATALHQPAPEPAPRAHRPRRRTDALEIDPDEIVDYQGEATVTLTMPLYRPDDTPPPPGKHRRR